MSAFSDGVPTYGSFNPHWRRALAQALQWRSQWHGEQTPNGKLQRSPAKRNMRRNCLFSSDICLQLLEDVVVNDQSRYCYNFWWIMISVKLQQIGMQYLLMIMITAELVLLQLMVDCWWLLIAGSSV